MTTPVCDAHGKPTVVAIPVHKSWRTDGGSEVICALGPLRESY
jgi:hypothetical protein